MKAKIRKEGIRYGMIEKIVDICKIEVTKGINKIYQRVFKLISKEFWEDKSFNEETKGELGQKWSRLVVCAKICFGFINFFTAILSLYQIIN